MGMGVDETGMQQPVCRGDFDRLIRGGATGRTDLVDRIVLDQDIGGLRRSGSDVEHAAAPQDRISHRIVSIKRAA